LDLEHRDLIRRLQSAPDRTLNDLGNRLKTLRDARQSADYTLGKRWDDAQARTSAVLAQKFVQLLDSTAVPGSLAP
jgi:hypothetical protein